MGTFRCSLALSACLVAGACGDDAQIPAPPQRSITDVLAGDSAGFARAERPRAFVFPRDHGAHSEFRTEWWYFTGHLRDGAGREFGFQLTFFRSALAAAGAEVDAGTVGASAWRPDDLWMAHFAVGDFAGEMFRPYERFARGAVGLAGASVNSLNVWLEDWYAEALRPDDPASPVRLVARDDGAALDVVLRPQRSPLLQGDQGLSQKGSQPGNASYYYSVTRWSAEGTLAVAGESLGVTGAAWMDREWSSSALEPGQIGWDWFSLQLDDGSDLMLYVMRRDDGSVDLASSGTWLSPTGEVQSLERAEFALLATAVWTSPGGVDYPAAWQITVPSLGLDLGVRPLLADQELRGAFRYWEGGVGATGTRDGQQVGGRGFAELTGYRDGRSSTDGD